MVKHHLSFQALRVTLRHRITEDNLVGMNWHTTPNCIEGNLAGTKVPTLVLLGTYAPHLVLHEFAYDLSPAKDKEMVGFEDPINIWHRAGLGLTRLSIEPSTSSTDG